MPSAQCAMRSRLLQRKALPPDKETVIMKQKVLIFFCIIILVTASTVRADRSKIELVGKEPFGPAYAVYAVNNYAYVGAGSVLAVLDVSKPSNPTEIGWIDTRSTVLSVHVVGDYAYVANYKAGLCVVDVSYPKNPSEVGSYATASPARGVCAVGDYAYVTTGKYGLRVIDVSDPANPVEIGSYVTPRAAYGVQIVGDFAYVSGMSRGLWVIKVSTPMNLRKIGQCDIPGGEIRVAGKYAYVASGKGLRVVVVSDPCQPRELGS